MIKQYLIPAMAEVGRRFERGEFYVLEMLIAARAHEGRSQRPRAIAYGPGPKACWRVIIGTAQGDLHDIGNNLVGMMLEGADFQVVGLGVDVAPAKLVQAVREQHLRLIGLSALLTTTMPNMTTAIAMLEEAGLGDKVKVIVGGAAVTERYAHQIGADGYAPDPASAVRKSRELLGLA